MKYGWMVLAMLSLAACGPREPEPTVEGYREYNENRAVGEPEWTTQEDIDMRRNGRTANGRRTEQAVRNNSGTITTIYENTMRGLLTR